MSWVVLDLPDLRVMDCALRWVDMLNAGVSPDVGPCIVLCTSDSGGPSQTVPHHDRLVSRWRF